MTDGVSLLSIAGGLQQLLTNYILLCILKTQWGCHTLKVGYIGEVGIILEKEQYDCWRSGALQWAGDDGGVCREMGRVKKKDLKFYLPCLSLTHPRFFSCFSGSSPPPPPTHGFAVSCISDLAHILS